MELHRKRLLQVGNIVVPIVIGIVSMLISMGSRSAQEVFAPDEYEKLLGPAAITFAIWGPIFIGLASFVVYQARDLFKSKEERVEMPYVHQVNIFFIVSVVAAVSWYTLWAQRKVLLSFISIFVFLVSILIAYFRLDINLTPRSLKEHVIITVGWSLYAGWVVAANIVSLTTVVMDLGFEILGITEIAWTIAMLIVALLIYSAFLCFRKDYIFAAVGVWVLIGVILERFISSQLYPKIVITAVIGLVILVTEMLYFYLVKGEKIFPIISE